jgi:hypothetical protein
MLVLKILACALGISLAGCSTPDPKPPRACTCPAYPTNFPPVIYAP